MTIGIGASGPRAGEAVFKALFHAEKVGEGSIGGFAVYVVETKDGRCVYYKTQRGGAATLITRGEATGGFPPADVLEAPIAGVISSGPDRPEPLERILPAKSRVGLVTGHRIPIAACKVHSTAINQEALDLMESGLSPSASVDRVLAENPHADVGLIAVGAAGEVAAANTPRVAQRNDVAKIYRADPAKNARVAVLMNEIHPVPGVAELAAGVAMDTLTERRRPDAEVLIKTGVRVEHGPEDELHVDDKWSVVKLVTSDRDNLTGRKLCCIPYGGAKVVRSGKVVGRVISEPLTTMEDGVVADLSGQKEFYVAIKLV